MNIFINDKKKNIAESITLSILIEEVLLQQKKGIAVAVNEDVINKEKWTGYKLHENDKVLIITATKGG